MKFIIFMLSSCASLKIYQSIYKGQPGESGLKCYKPNYLNFLTNSLSFCMRFNYKKLDTILFHFNSPDSDIDTILHFKYPYSFFGWGFDSNPRSFKSWLLKDPKTNNFDIWCAYKWHHVCFAYDSNTNHIVLIKVYSKN